MNWLLALTMITSLATAAPVVVIAHRGASGYLPEHTRDAKALAIGMGADFVEQDVVLTKDDVPIVTHDITLEDISDIASVYPGRARADGHYYAIDFNMSELRVLTRRERVNDDGSMVYPHRFHGPGQRFPIVTLAEEIEFVQGTNLTTGRNVGLYTEVKHPAWYRQQGKDITRVVLDMLAHYGYRRRSDNVYFQCFDALELKRVRTELKSDLKLIQLIGENSWQEAPTDYDALMSERGMAEVATYADGIGPEIVQLVEWPKPGAAAHVKPLAGLAKRHHLLMHPYTLRIDDLPPNAPSAIAVLDALFDKVKVDGLFSDFSDVVVQYRAAHRPRR
jgi:glycerophosphoryl diester phosphodiesterase